MAGCGKAILAKEEACRRLAEGVIAMKRGERVRVRLLAKVDKWLQGKTGIVDTDSRPGEVVLVSLDDEAVQQQFLEEDLERID
jgi:hypothetical protein